MAFTQIKGPTWPGLPASFASHLGVRAMFQGKRIMNIYHIYANLKSGVNDLEFADAVKKYLGHLQHDGLLESFRITRRKLGLGPKDLLEFHILVEFKTMDQFDRTFGTVATRSEPIESLHFAVNSKVAEVKFALYRDFPDEVRKVGEERF
jgi:hypothetical protein